jgi:excinuclease UvrABC helicase subunit UvrB
LIDEIQDRVKLKEKILVTTLTKKNGWRVNQLPYKDW